MSLKLKIVSKNADLLGNDYVREFHESGATIGRSLRNDWILPDPDRYISGKHATIDFRGGMYYLADISSNGVYVNDEMDPIGNGNPRRLFDGDRLHMGDFEFEVSIDTGESLEMPPDPKPGVVPDNIEQLVDEVSLRTGIKLLDEEEISGDEEFQSALFGSESKKVEAKDNTKDNDAAKAESKSLDVSADDLFDSFLDGLGINRAELLPSVNRPDMMMTAGQILREFVSGMTDLLTSRANLKDTFRLDQTTVLPHQNNPMKFSQNTGDLIKQLLLGSEGEYLGARDAIREVSRDLLNHQNAFIDAMNSAFIEFADRLDPDELQERFDKSASGVNFFGFSRRKNYWQQYCDLYPILTEKGGGRFPQMFGEEFVKAYERQVEEYRRHDRDTTESHESHESHDSQVSGYQALDPALLRTQKLVSPAVDEESAVVNESAFDAGDTIASISESESAELDQSFIDELEDSLSDEIAKDQTS